MSKSTITATFITTAKGNTSAAKKPKHHHDHDHNYNQNHDYQQREQELKEINQQKCLLPGLPDHIAQLCLSQVQPSILYSVCQSWRHLIYSPSCPPFLSIYALLLPKTMDQSHDSHLSNSIKFSCFDPISSKWLSLPSQPPDPPLRLLLRHPSFISRRLPIQSVRVSGKLVLLAATADQFQPALNRPLVFYPLSQSWIYGPQLAAPRRWCATGALAGCVYIASGVGSHYNLHVAQSAEKWDLEMSNQGNTISMDIINKNKRKRDSETTTTWKWEKMGGLRDGKFSRDAIDAVGWRGKLCMVNVKGDAAKEGIIYDVKSNAWEEMPEGMLVGWRGPAASMDEEIIYMVNESQGTLRKYDPAKDIWVEILESKMLKGAQCVAAAGGRVCIVGGDGAGIVVVDVTVQPPRLWVVDTPPGFQAAAIHILPRMSQQDFQSPVLDSISAP